MLTILDFPSGLADKNDDDGRRASLVGERKCSQTRKLHDVVP